MTKQVMFTNILIMLSGLAVFMFGLRIMSERLEKQAGNKLHRLFEKAGNNRFIGVGVGAGVTAIIQSSSATTVMVVGFVNAGLLTLFQATAVIMGANIGTTVTAVIISLPIKEIVAAVGLVGVFMIMLSKTSGIRNLGYILVSLGMIFTGLNLMGSSMKAFAALQSLVDFFASTQNPIFLIIIGALITALIQSSSATTGILISMSIAGLINLESAIYIILGVNIGTCITAFLASIGNSVNARRAAIIHLMFNVAGTVLFIAALSINPVKEALYSILKPIPGTSIAPQIALFHIIFNVTTTLLLLPFISVLVKLSTKIIREKAIGKNEPGLKYSDNLMLETPPIAVFQIKKDIIRMAEMAKANYDLAIDSIVNYSLANEEDFDKREKYIDWLNQAIPDYLTKVSSKHISYKDEVIISSYYHIVSDIERIGDYSENLIGYVKRLKEDRIRFSEQAIEELSSLNSEIDRLYALSIEGFNNTDVTLMSEINRIEDRIDNLKNTLSEMHIKRLNEGICTSQSGAIFLSMISNMQRIAEHIRNIYKSIRKYAKLPKETAGVLNRH